jgi:hypothetical protein
MLCFGRCVPVTLLPRLSRWVPFLSRLQNAAAPLLLRPRPLLSPSHFFPRPLQPLPRPPMQASPCSFPLARRGAVERRHGRAGAAPLPRRALQDSCAPPWAAQLSPAARRPPLFGKRQPRPRPKAPMACRWPRRRSMPPPPPPPPPRRPPPRPRAPRPSPLPPGPGAPPPPARRMGAPVNLNRHQPNPGPQLSCPARPSPEPPLRGR